jgi:hypothetical protein
MHALRTVVSMFHATFTSSSLSLMSHLLYVFLGEGEGVLNLQFAYGYLLMDVLLVSYFTFKCKINLFPTKRKRR